MSILRRLLPDLGQFFQSRQGSRFSRQAAAYFRRLDEEWFAVTMPALPACEPPIGLLLTPWGTNAVPFFTAELALQLRRAGHSVAVIFDESDVCGNASDEEELALVRELTDRLEKFMPVHRVESGSDETDISFESFVFEDCVRRARCEAGGRNLVNAESVAGYRRAAAAAMRTLRMHSWKRLVFPGGLWALGGVYAASAEHLGIPFITYDAGYSCLAIARDGAAAHFPDFADAYARSRDILNEDQSAREYVIAEALRLLNIRRAGRDEFKLQPQGTGKPVEAFQIVVPLNYRIDTAAMQRGLAFPDVTTWLKATVDWAAQHGSVRMAVRQHPCEKIPEFRSKEDYSWIGRVAPDRIRFIAADDPINTYDLLDTCQVVLPYTSRSGLDAALMGRHVVVGARTYYAGCDFVQTGATAEEYFHKIEAALMSPVPPYPESDRALAYYLVEKCTLTQSDFTPMPSDLNAWLSMDPEKLAETPSVRMLVDGLPGGRNFLFERFRKHVSERPR